MTFSPQNHLVAAGFFEHADVHLCDFGSGRVVGELKGPSDKVHALNALEFSSDGRWLLSSLTTPTSVHLWDVARQKEVWKVNFEGYLQQVRISPDDKVAIITEDDKIHFLDLETGRRVRKPLDAARTLFRNRATIS